MKIAVVVGTRPELIKMAVLINELKKRDSSHLFIHSGQHYDYHMDGMVSELFNLPKPDYHFDVKSGTHATTTATIMTKLEDIIVKEKIEKIIVHGDTNTTLAASLAAAKTFIPIAHVEAGLRSFDKTMPEEINRIVVDHMSTYLFCPTKDAIKNLHNEGIFNGIHHVGQTIVDAVEFLKQVNSVDVLKKYQLSEKQYFFLTIHRQENTDNLLRLISIFLTIHELSQNSNYKLVLAMHPRTKKILQQHNMFDSLIKNNNILLLDPPPNFYESILLQQHAKLVLTDSGGLQEESCILGTPCITLRENTERPETIECGSNILAGYKRDTIIKAVEDSIMKSTDWTNPYGSPGISKRILDLITN
ncbi:non-hydrolyzing UDP-N-acetylglucosamine 2-epimerase [Sutcliffiella halmapala]|uniref:non-hydrolyzing UDP-N-acetylglucosamine 2-epimerase n=1 Tax=Sutcliffiella halmapala TaxID=79882 RepID=UPI000995A7FD|nr:UDP-N-acetylglucosamine 2-epimerase (non-hydrolyzing) [Sutcliffiella halmapala]